MLLIGAIALLIAGVAAAAQGLGGGEEQVTDPSTASSNTDSDVMEPTGVSEPTTVIDPTVVTDSTEAGEPTTESTQPTTYTSEPGGITDTSEETPEPAVHPDNFGGTISSMRHAGDHTPAAVVRGKMVPGYQKKATTTTTQPTVTTEAPQV
jgi:hypothetical protein